MKTSEEFRLSGYEVHLIFMGLDSIEESIQRVEQRVRLGGHKVDEESIRYNYKHGFANLYKYFRQFDSVTLYDNSISDKPEFVIPIEIGYFYQGKLELNTDIYPDWVKPIVDLFK